MKWVWHSCAWRQNNKISFYSSFHTQVVFECLLKFRLLIIQTGLFICRGSIQDFSLAQICRHTNPGYFCFFLCAAHWVICQKCSNHWDEFSKLDGCDYKKTHIIYCGIFELLSLDMGEGVYTCTPLGVHLLLEMWMDCGPSHHEPAFHITDTTPWRESCGMWNGGFSPHRKQLFCQTIDASFAQVSDVIVCEAGWDRKE